MNDVCEQYRLVVYKRVGEIPNFAEPGPRRDRLMVGTGDRHRKKTGRGEENGRRRFDDR